MNKHSSDSGEVSLIEKITLSADKRLIEAARGRASAENTTLNERFWLRLAD